MERKNTQDSPSNKGTDRDARLKAALKANMSRRKKQARARSQAGEQSRSQEKE